MLVLARSRLFRYANSFLRAIACCGLPTPALGHAQRHCHFVMPSVPLYEQLSFSHPLAGAFLTPKNTCANHSRVGIWTRFMGINGCYCRLSFPFTDFTRRNLTSMARLATLPSLQFVPVTCLVKLGLFIYSYYLRHERICSFRTERTRMFLFLAACGTFSNPVRLPHLLSQHVSRHASAFYPFRASAYSDYSIE